MLDLVFVILALGLLATVWSGAPYFPTEKKTRDEMLRLAGDVSGKHVMDLGAGDGRLVIAFAEAGAMAEGVELNPLLVVIANVWIKRRGLSSRAHVRFGNMWKTNIATTDVIVVFGIPRIMKKLGDAFFTEAKPGALLLSHAFPIPGATAENPNASGVYAYRKTETSAQPAAVET